MTKSKKILAFGIVAIVLAGAIAGWYAFRLEINGCGSLRSKVDAPVADYFSKTLEDDFGKKIGGFPIEGFQPFMFMGGYPGLHPSDFNCVKAYDGGVYLLKDEKLVFVSQKSMRIISSAERSVTTSGMNQLFQNIVTRLARPVPRTNAEVDDIINTLSVNPVTVVTSAINKLSACPSIPNGSTQTIIDTTRMFINIPKDVYPDKENNLQFKTVSGNSTSGYISNGGLPGLAFETTPECWSYYNEFDGIGEVDLTVKSAMKNMPDYFVRFIVVPNPQDIITAPAKQ